MTFRGLFIILSGLLKKLEVPKVFSVIHLQLKRRILFLRAEQKKSQFPVLGMLFGPIPESFFTGLVAKYSFHPVKIPDKGSVRYPAGPYV